MTPEQFVHWMRGFIDGVDHLKPISNEQVSVIRKKLNEVNHTYGKTLLTEIPNNNNNMHKIFGNVTTTYDTFENKNQLKLEL